MFFRPTVRGFGKFHAQEIKVHAQYSEYRSEGHQVTTLHLAKWMLAQCRDDLPVGFDPNKKNFGKGWTTRFMKRWGISRQRKRKNKSENVFQRLHEISNYHYFTIHLWQNPEYYEEPYFAYENYVTQHPADLVDEDSSEFYVGSTTNESDSD